MSDMLEETIERVGKCVAEVLALDPDQVQPHSRLMDDLNADSLDLVELMYLLEQEFDITLSRKDLSIAATSISGGAIRHLARPVGAPSQSRTMNRSPT